MLPGITHLQFLVLKILSVADCCGKFIREKLVTKGISPRTQAAFSMLMGRMETDNLVEGWYDVKVIAGQTIRGRRYKITEKGIKEIEKCHEFYNR
jgi:DNA-binding MarR family transcriptional regulator